MSLSMRASNAQRLEKNMCRNLLLDHYLFFTNAPNFLATKTTTKPSTKTHAADRLLRIVCLLSIDLNRVMRDYRTNKALIAQISVF